MAHHISDQTYLLSQQYQDGTRLSARATLHARFRTNPNSWFTWLFDHFHLGPTSHILELGCGPGWLWRQNQSRIAEGWEITLSDFSSGMLDEARRNLSNVPHPFNFAVVDAQAIPYQDQTFDVVIANHMLYHVPDRAQAIAEVRRVLKSGGHFYASTISQAHFRELGRFTAKTPYDSGAGEQDPNQRFPFNLENGAEQLAVSFAQVVLHRYEDTLVVTEAEPLIAYLASMSAYDANTASDEKQQQVAEVYRRVHAVITAEGAIRITNAAGLFEAW